MKDRTVSSLIQYLVRQGEHSFEMMTDMPTDLQSESKCIFGISRRPATLPDSPLQLNAFFKNCNYMLLSAPEDRIF